MMLLKSIHHCLQVAHRGAVLVEPWGILIAVFGVGVALWEIQTDRNVRAVTLFALAAERVSAARVADAENNRQVPTADEGQVELLERTVRVGVSLERMGLHDVNLNDINLVGADLSQVDLRDSSLILANLNGAYLDGANARCVNFTGATLIGAHLERAQLDDSLFKKATPVRTRTPQGSLARADLSKTYLIGTEFNSISLAGTNFTGARFENVRFENVDLTEAVGLTQKQLEGACKEGDVRLPEKGFEIKDCKNAPDRGRTREDQCNLIL